VNYLPVNAHTDTLRSTSRREKDDQEVIEEEEEEEIARGPARRCSPRPTMPCTTRKEDSKNVG